MKKFFWIVLIIIVAVALYRVYVSDTVPADGGPLVSEPVGSIIPGNIIVDNIDIVFLESFPLQVRVGVSGHLGDACTTVGEIVTNRVDNDFIVDISADRPADAICAQVLTPFEESIALDVHGLPKGVYTVNVNGVIDSFEFQTDNILNL